MLNKSARFSKLLPFPRDIVNALQEDEIHLDSVLRGKFASGRSRLAWLACGPHLEVTNTITAERISAYHFSGVTDQSPTVAAVKEFSWQRKTGLLVGLKNSEGSVLCLYNVGISKVVKAVVLPGSVIALEPIINHGGASASTQHLHQSLRWFFGVAAAVTDAGHILLIDLCLDDLTASQDELEASDLEMIRGVTTEIPRLRDNAIREHRHLCLELQALTGASVSTMSYISRTNQLAVGFSDGQLSLWNMKTLRLEYHTQIEGGSIPIFSINFQEPENDPRHCCYLWVVQSSQSGDVSLHLLQMAFGDRNCMTSGNILYENLEYCEERYSLDLSSSAMLLGEHATSIKLLSCQTIEKFCAPRDYSIHEVTSPETSVCIFAWQMNGFEPDASSIYLGVFDINRWYQAQMPDSLRQGQFLRSCSYFAFWSLEDLSNVTTESIIDILVQERSLNRGAPPSYPPPEQFFFPSNYNFDAICLLTSGIVHVKCIGSQKQTLGILKKPGYSLKQTVPQSFKGCLVAGLVSPRLIDAQFNISEDEKLKSILSAAVDTNSHALLSNCIKQNVQTGQSENLRFLLEFTWNKMVITKDEFDTLCAPLFDGSCNFIDQQTLKSLQKCHQRFRNLTSIMSCFVKEASTITPQGLTDLGNKKMVGNHLMLYASVVLWFCRVGLLPDNTDESMQLNRPYYDYKRTEQYYLEQRKKMEHLSSLSRGKWKGNSLMIDRMISRLGIRVKHLWTRDGHGTGIYPPSSLHALLDLYLLETADEMSKHAITIYFLLDVMVFLPDKNSSSIDSFPSAFSLPPGLIKHTQGLWLLDHDDSQNAMDCILHPSATRLMTWQHAQIIENLMRLGDHKLAMRYIMVMKPPATTTHDVKMLMTVFLTNGNVLEAWNLQRDHSTLHNSEELLKDVYEICSEMGLMGELMKVNMTPLEQDVLQKFLGTSGNVRNQEMLLVHYLQRANYTKALQLNQSMKNTPVEDRDPRLCERAVFRNAMLNQLAKFIPGVQQSLDRERADHKPPQRKEVSRPKPLSATAKPAKGRVVTKSSFIKNVLSKIKEVALAYDDPVSPEKSPGIDELPSNVQDSAYPGLFFGLPLSKLRNISRLHNSLTKDSASPAPDYNIINNVLSPAVKFVPSSPVQNTTRPGEFSLLETPVVVKRAKALATKTLNTTYCGFTPQSILRSTIRTTPPASLSASPRRSVTPPFLPKEPKISFMEDIGKFSTSVLSPDRSLPVISATDIEQPEMTVTSALFPLSTPDTEQKATSEIQDNRPFQIETSKEMNVSVRSDETSLEFHDAPTPEDLEGDVVTGPCSSDDSEPMDVEMSEVYVLESVHIENEMTKENVEAIQSIHDTDLIASKPLDRTDEELISKVESFEQLPQIEEPVIETTVLPCIETQVVRKEDRLSESGVDFHLLHQNAPTESVSNFAILEHHYSTEFAVTAVDSELNNAEGEHFVEQTNFSLVLEAEDNVDEVQQSVKDPSTDSTDELKHKSVCEESVGEKSPISVLLPACNIKCTAEMPPSVNTESGNNSPESLSEHSRVVLKPPTPRRSIKTFSESDSEEMPSTQIRACSEKPTLEQEGEDNVNLLSAPEVEPTLPRTRSGKQVQKTQPDMENVPEPPATPTRARKKRPQTQGDTNATGEDPAPAQPPTPTRSCKSKFKVQNDEVDLQSLPVLPTTPTRALRRKVLAQDQIKPEDPDSTDALPPTPSRITRSKKMELNNVTSTNNKANDHQLSVATPVKGRRGRRPVNELVKHFELSSSQPDSTSPPVSPKRLTLRWTKNRSQNKLLEEVFLKAIEQNADNSEKPVKSISEAKDIVSEIPVEPALDKVETSVSKTKKRKGSSPTTTKDSDTLELPESQDLTSVTYAFSTPVPKRRKTKAAAASLEHVDPQSSSTYVFSPPSTRSGRVRRSSNRKVEKLPSTPEPGENLDSNPIPKRRGRPPKHATQQMSVDKGAWSPPPVTISLLTPPEKTDASIPYSKPEPGLTTTQKKTLKKRKLLSKSVSRRTLR
uniref:AT-hook containing transcription factor 1 n=1 Tax=Leptobrachium leishanense TaxID=445787 RepID=A0A8C5WF62_9ANUR